MVDMLQRPAGCLKSGRRAKVKMTEDTSEEAELCMGEGAALLKYECGAWWWREGGSVTARKKVRWLLLYLTRMRSLLYKVMQAVSWESDEER